MSVLDRKLGRDLGRALAQVVTLALVVGCGVGVFVGSVSCARALRVARDRYYDAYRFADVFAQVKRAPLTLLDRLSAIPGVSRAVGRVVTLVPAELPGLDEPAQLQLVSIVVGAGTDPAREVNGLHLVTGRFPERPTEIVVNQVFAEKARLRPGDRVRALLHGRRETLTIVGVGLSPEFVLQMAPGAISPDDRRFGVGWAPRELLEGALDLDGAFNDLQLALAPGVAREGDVIDAVDRLLAPYGTAGAFGRDRQPSAKFVAEELQQLGVTALIAPSLFLGVGLFLLHVLLGRMVASDREQIGALKALGYSDAALALHYAKLALAMVGVGAVLGVAIGGWLMRVLMPLYAEFYRFPSVSTRLEVREVALALGLSAAAALVGALQAVRQVVALQPVEAMRPPAPPVFRRTRLERLVALAHSPRWRMLARTLAHRPLRALLSSVAIGFAVAVTIAGAFVGDSLDLLLDRRFRQAEREDLTVTFLDPVRADACRELRSLPTVTACEPVRQVPVRVRARQLERMTVVVAAPTGFLRRVLDERGREIGVPDEGAVVSRWLAERLEVRRGDALTVEVQEGERRRLAVRVVDLVEDEVGISLYVAPRALDRLLGEVPAMSGALLLTDGGPRAPLLAALKRRPRVLAVAYRDDALRAFEETNGKTMRVFNVVLVLFATIIAVGVVYNGARVALSERSRELASLRVLGFTDGEVARLLFGEQAAQLVVGLPAGVAMGWSFARMMVGAFAREELRLPLLIAPATYALALGAVVAAALGSALIVRRKVDRLDLLTAMKIKE